jgi:hypothetical protein
MTRLPLFVLSSLLFVPFVHAQDTDTPEKHEGTAPRASADKYPAHAEEDGVSLGAELLTHKKASTTFAADVNRCCLVVHVAVYPKKDELIDLAIADFALTEVGSDIPQRPESATVIAAKIEKEKSPLTGKSMTPHGVVGVGYDTGTYTDPNTGQPVRGHTVSTGGAVAVTPDPSKSPADADHDREVIERELYEKALPEAKVSIPVAGYLYFSLPKPKKGAKYELTYSGISTPIVLDLVTPSAGSAK